MNVPVERHAQSDAKALVGHARAGIAPFVCLRRAFSEPFNDQKKIGAPSGAPIRQRLVWRPFAQLKR